MKKLLFAILFAQLIWSIPAHATPFLVMDFHGNISSPYDEFDGFVINIGDLSPFQLITVRGEDLSENVLEIKNEGNIFSEKLTSFLTRTYPYSSYDEFHTDESWMYEHEVFIKQLRFYDINSNGTTGGGISQQEMLDLSGYQIENYFFTQEYFVSDQGTNFQFNLYAEASPIPEPSSIILFSAGLVGLASASVRRKKKKQIPR